MLTVIAVPLLSPSESWLPVCTYEYAGDDMSSTDKTALDCCASILPVEKLHCPFPSVIHEAGPANPPLQLALTVTFASGASPLACTVESHR